MTTASLTTSELRPVSRDMLFLAIAIGITALLVALVWLDGQPASAALILGGFGLGAAFRKLEFSYTASWRRFLTKGEAGGINIPLQAAEHYYLITEHIEGLSIKETAAVLGIEQTAVKSRLLRARLLLREKLSKHFKLPPTTQPDAGWPWRVSTSPLD
ncbi:hypothetical protein B4Q13_23465 [Lacticaseibacillus rhamnosus]